MKVHIPNSAFLGNIDQFLLSFDPSHKGSLELTANERWFAVHPVVLAMTAALGLQVPGSKIRHKAFTAKSRHYLERMGLFRFLGTDSGMRVHEHEPSGRFIPLTQIKTSEELSRFITEMIPLLHLQAEQAESIRYVISELVRNVLEHAGASDGAVVSAQYYKKSNTIGIGIADTGLGIKATINRSWSAPTDLEAIRLALTPGITGTTRREGGTELNAGAGLFFIKSIASVNRNFFVLYSGKAMYKLLKNRSRKRIMLHGDPFKDRHAERSDLPYWQGTVVGISISLEETPEFSTLLDFIRKEYGKAVRERRKTRYRKPQFV